MKVYNIVKHYGRHTIHQGKKEVLASIEGTWQDAVDLMIDTYAKFNDSDFFPNEDATSTASVNSIKDETGRQIWRRTGDRWNDGVIVTPDFSYHIEEL